MRLKKQTFLFFICATVLILVTYGDIYKTFFQQDEWGSLPRYMYWNSVGPIPLWEAFKISFARSGVRHFAPLNHLGTAMMVWLFGFKFNLYATLSLSLHLLNSLLVFYLAKTLTKRDDVGFLAGLFFAVTSIHYHPIVWVSASSNTLGAAFFSLLSLIFFIKYLEKKKKKPFRFCLIFSWLALGFKESALFLFLFIPAYWLLQESRHSPLQIKVESGGRARFDKKTKKDFFLFFVNVGLYLAIALFVRLLNLGDQLASVPLEKSLPKVSTIVYQVLTLPFKVFSQVFVFPNHLFFLVEKWVELAHPGLCLKKGTTFYDLIIQTAGAELFSYVLATIFFLVVVGVYFLLKKDKRNRLLKSLIFSVLLILASVVPSLLFLYQGQKGILFIMRPRELYVSSAGAMVLLSIVTIFLLEKIVGKKRRFLSWVFICLVFSLFFFYHQRTIKNHVFPTQIERAEQRKNILDQILQTYPEITPRSIFYTESDTSYYGHSEPSLPFQTGTGRSILFWYAYHTKSHPLKFFESNFLYLFNEEGYQEINGKGFGYYLDFDKMLVILKQKNLPTESVYAFRWFGRSNKLEDITPQIREEVKNQ